MGKGFSIESLNDVEGLKGKIGLELMWGIHGRADAELRKSLPNQKDSSKDEEHIELSESEKMFNRKLLQLAEASDNTKQFRHLMDEIPRIDDELNGSEVEFRSFAENRVKEVYSEDVKDNYDEETLERLNEISDFSWSDLERSLTNCSDLEPETTHYVNLVNSWSENLRPVQVVELLSDEYAGLVYNHGEGFQNPSKIEDLKNAIEALAESNFDEGYREVLEDVEQLGFDEGAEYLEELQYLAGSAYQETVLEYKQNVLKEIMVLADEAETHHQLIADTDNAVSTLRNKSPGEAELMADMVDSLYSKALQKSIEHK